MRDDLPKPHSPCPRTSLAHINAPSYSNPSHANIAFGPLTSLCNSLLTLTPKPTTELRKIQHTAYPNHTVETQAQHQKGHHHNTPMSTNSPPTHHHAPILGTTRRPTTDTDTHSSPTPITRKAASLNRASLRQTNNNISTHKHQKTWEVAPRTLH